MFTYQKFNVKLVILTSILVITLFAIAGWSNTFAANYGDIQMRVPNASAREIWSSADEIDAHVDAVKAELISRGADEQVLGSIEQYRQLLQNSLATGEPMSNSNMESMSFSSPKELLAELEARGIDAKDLGIDVESRFREFRESRRDDLPPD